jgi:nucleotide-binding universal stress UspA family protein
MTDQPILLCAGPDADAARLVADQTATLMRERPVVVLGVWLPAGALPAPIDAVLGALYGVREELDERARSACEASVAAAAEQLRAAGRSAEERVVCGERRFWQVALALADELDAAAIALSAFDDPDAAAGALGSEARALAHRSRRPLFMVPLRAPAPAGPAVFAFDGSDASATALDAGAALLAPRPALVMTAWESIASVAPMSLAGVPAGVAAGGAEELDAAAHDVAARSAAAGVAALAERGWEVRAQPLEAPRGVCRGLVDAAADADAAVVVTGTRGHGRIVAAILGSVAEGLLRHAGRPVLLVPPDMGSPA